MKKKIFISITLISSLVISSCIGVYANNFINEEATVDITVDDNIVDLTPKAPVYSQSQLSPDYTTYETITLKDNNSKSSSTSVTIDNNIITINKGGTYIVSGKLSNGQIVINSEDETVQLVLDNVIIHNETNAPIYIEASKKLAMITLKDSSTNTLTDGNDYVNTGDEDIDAVIYSKQDLIINGNGTLNITANYNDGIKSKDSLHIVNGTYNITSKQDAFYGKDAITIDDGIFNVTTSTGADSVEMVKEQMGGPINFEDMPEDFDLSQFPIPEMPEGNFDFSQMQPPINGFENKGETGMKERPLKSPMENSINMDKMKPFNDTTTDTRTKATTSTKGIQEEIQVDDNGSSKGFKSKGEIVINNGTFVLDTYDDSINANTFLEINDGTFTLKSGDDALKADYLLTINNGNITIEHSYEGIEAKVIHFIGGEVNVTSFDDGINASDPEIDSSRPLHIGPTNTPIDYDNDPLIYFSGSNVTVNGDGDAIDANGSIIMTKGNVTVFGLNQVGELAVDFDNAGIINGGNFLVLGGVTTISTSSTQNIVSTSLKNTINIGDTVKITDSTGTVLFETIALNSTDAVTFSSLDVVQGETYTISYGNNKDTITTSNSSNITNNVENKINMKPKNR